VEKAVSKRIVLQSGHGVGWVVAGCREHVMPLQDLMQQHAIHEPSEADSEEERR
jgi:hypothetical protein